MDHMDQHMAPFQEDQEGLHLMDLLDLLGQEAHLSALVGLVYTCMDHIR